MVLEHRAGTLHITGVLQKTGPSVWTVSGLQAEVGQQTRIEGPVANGDVVLATMRVGSDGLGLPGNGSAG